MIKVGDLVRYSWADEVGIVVKIKDEEEGVMVMVRWSERFAEENKSAKTTWWTKPDRWLVKVEK